MAVWVQERTAGPDVLSHSFSEIHFASFFWPRAVLALWDGSNHGVTQADLGVWNLCFLDIRVRVGEARCMGICTSGRKTRVFLRKQTCNITIDCGSVHKCKKDSTVYITREERLIISELGLHVHVYVVRTNVGHTV